MDNLLNKLNEKQKEAVLCTEGPLLVLAGAGSGKTNTMIHRIAYMIKEKGISPYNIMAVTFTNKAAKEMRERIERLLGDDCKVWIMTFHATCLRLLRMYGEKIGYTKDFVVYDPADQKSIIKKILKENEIDEKIYKPANVLGAISDAKNQGIKPDSFEIEFGGGYRNEVIAKIYRQYVDILLSNNAMDFDDLLCNAVTLLKKNNEVLQKCQDKFKYIMVDEYQDTNKIQYDLIRLLVGEKENLCVVGDDDQCIYQWRGADISNILDFEKDFKGAKRIKLEQNYRSTSNILNAANSIIEYNTKRKGKRLWTDNEEGTRPRYRRLDNEKEEAYYIGQEIDRIKNSGNSYKDFAVLYRTNAQARNFEEILTARRIPYRVFGGVRYYDRKEIKDIVAYMRLILNPKDDLALTRVINEPKRGIGPKTISTLAALAKVRKESIFETLMDQDVISSLSPKTYSSISAFINLIAKYNQEKDNLRVSDIYDGVLRDSGYIALLDQQNTLEAQNRIENILEFKSTITTYEEEGELQLAEFLEKIALVADVDNLDKDEEAVTLMTFHSAKGLEFPFVFMVGMEDGLFPGWRSLEDEEKLEEERRLCYVGMTRAMKSLWLTSAEYRVIFGQGEYTRESTFMREINPKFIEGDGVYKNKSEAKLGTSQNLDGMSSSGGYAPLNQYKEAKRKIVPKKTVETFVQGDSVTHGKFGKGTVVEVKGNIITVIFETAGQKKLAADIAPIAKN